MIIIQLQFNYVTVFFMKNIKTISIFILCFLVLGSLTSCSFTEEKSEDNNISNITVWEKINESEKVRDEILDKKIEEEMMDKKDVMASDDNKEWTEEEKKEMESEEMKKQEAKMMKWEYIEYSENAVKNASWNIVLFFHANWCPTCKAFEKQVLSENIPEWLTILKVDYDNSDDLKKKYSVLTQTTFVQIDSNWNMIKRWIWGKWIDSVIEKIK